MKPSAIWNWETHSRLTAASRTSRCSADVRIYPALASWSPEQMHGLGSALTSLRTEGSFAKWPKSCCWPQRLTVAHSRSILGAVGGGWQTTLGVASFLTLLNKDSRWGPHFCSPTIVLGTTAPHDRHHLYFLANSLPWKWAGGSSWKHL